MVTRGIRDFVLRDWQAVRDHKDAYWSERIARLGPLEAWRIADELRRQARAQHPGWPSAADRVGDLESHVRLADLFRRGSPTRRR